MHKLKNVRNALLSSFSDLFCLLVSILDGEGETAHLVLAEANNIDVITQGQNLSLIHI